MERIRVGLVGYGVGKMYAAALRNVSLYYARMPRIDFVAVATATPKSGLEAVAQYGFERHTLDYRELVTAEDIDMLVIATPNYLHHEMLLSALETNKAIYVDKPLTNNYAQALEVLHFARNKGRDAQLILEFRFCPAVQLAHQIIAEGFLGKITNCRAVYFRSSYVDPEKPLRWKGSFALAGGGVTNDYMPHLVDLLVWLVGMPVRVVSRLNTFVEQRPESKSSREHVKIDTDDHAILLCEFKDGVIGTIEAGRMVVGASNDMVVEIRGTEGSLRWNLMNANYLYYAAPGGSPVQTGWRKIPTIQNYPDAVIPGADVPLGMMRFHIASVADFISRSVNQRPYDPGIEQGVRIQAVIESAQKSAQEYKWVEVPEIPEDSNA